MEKKLNWFVLLVTVVFSLTPLPGAALAANVSFDSYSWMERSLFYYEYETLDAGAHTELLECDGGYWECTTYEVGVDMTVYEDSVSIWYQTDVQTGGYYAAHVDTVSIPYDAAKTYTSNANHWASGDWGSYYHWTEDNTA